MHQKNKRVLCFIASLSAGGAERQMIELMKVLHGRGFDVELLTYAGRDQYDCPSYVKRHQVRCRYKFLLPIMLIYKICIVNGDCCISFLTTNNIVACLAKCLKPNRKIIVGERNCSAHLTRTKRLAYELYRIADYVVPNSESEARFIRNRAPWLAKKTIVIQNYTDIEQNHPRDKVFSGKMDVGVFARYTKQKNPLYLARVVKNLIDRGYRDFVFHWYGNIKQNLLEDDCSISNEYLEVKKYVDENDLKDHFILNDYVKNTSEIMANMDVICLPSLFEGFPNAISEGMACGKAIVASRVSDVPYIVKDGVNGFLFDPTDIESGVHAFIKYCKLSKEKRIEMAISNREKAIALFSKEKFSKDYINLISG